MQKVVSMEEAVSRFVKRGDILFLSGMQHGEPSAAIHEIVRQRIDHLTLISCLVATSGLLIAEGLVDRVITGFAELEEKRSYALARARSLNRLPRFEETSHFGICLALLAAQMGVPFLPARSLLGSDLMKFNENLCSTKCPFTGQPLTAVRAVTPDVGIIHVQRADAFGNAQKWGSLGADREGINASRKVIVTTEKVVSPEVIQRDPDRTIIPGFRVGAVVEEPWGAYPMHLSGCYHGDLWGFIAETRDKEGLERYLETFIHCVKNWAEYLDRRLALKGSDHFKNLRIKNPVTSDPVVTGY